ncbi:MAG: hypothetical protein ABSC06_12540 [Rhodopila sp.]|jgi:hypothetical protein
MNKSQQMRWSRRGANAVYNGTLGSVYEQKSTHLTIRNRIPGDQR